MSNGGSHDCRGGQGPAIIFCSQMSRNEVNLDQEYVDLGRLGSIQVKMQANFAPARASFE